MELEILQSDFNTPSEKSVCEKQQYEIDQENDGWWCDVWEYTIYEYTAWQKKIVSVFKEHIQPVIRKMVKAESEAQDADSD